MLAVRKIYMLAMAVTLIWGGGLFSRPVAAFHISGGNQQENELGLQDGKVLGLDGQPAGNGLAITGKAGAKAGGAGRDDPAQKDKGTDIWIPGIGVIGKMPNLDFGLEMLYGSPETESEREQLRMPEAAPDGQDNLNFDFAIKGTIKHKF